MSTVSSDDFGSLIALASQLHVMLCYMIVCLNPIGSAPKCQRQVIVYAHERTFSVTYCGSIMDSLPEVAFDHIKLTATAMSNYICFPIMIIYIKGYICSD